MLAFAVAGIGNGLFMVTVRKLIQKMIRSAAHGRAFGVLDAIDSWGFGAAIVAGGALAASLGGRTTFAIAGTLALSCCSPPPASCAAAPRTSPPSSFQRVEEVGHGS